MIYDIVVDMIKHFSLSLDILKPYATLLGVIVLLLRQNNIKKIINGHLPKKFRDTQSNDIYDIMKDIKDIKNHLGVESSWSSPEVGSVKTCPKLLRYWMKLKGVKNMEKLKSRKLWMAIFGALLPIINEEFNLGLNAETVIASVGAIVAYVLGQAHVDSKKVVTNEVKTPSTPNDQNYSH